MVDSFTNNRNIIQPLVGGDSGTWGGLLNSGAFEQLDLVLGATQIKSITTVDVTLTITEWNNCAIKLTGALTGNRNLILPFNANSATVAVGGLFVVDNETTGAYNITVKTQASGSTGVTVPQGKRTWLYSDTTNVYYADDSVAFMQQISGSPSGTLAGIQGSINNPPSVAWDYTNGVLYFCTATGSASTAVWTAVSPQAITRGFNAVINMSLSVTHTGGNLLNVALKTTSGTDPSLPNPAIAQFQTVSSNNTTGGVSSVTITAPLSMTTNATGASLGATNSTPFRIWFALFNNAGTVVLAMLNASTAAGILPVAEQGVASTVSISGSATSAGVWYTPNGTTLSSCAYRLIGYCEYTAGLVTAGTYTSDPTNVVMFGPGVRKPGDTVQLVIASTTTPGTTTSNTLAPLTGGLTAAITPTSAVNRIRVSTEGNLYSTAAASIILLQLARNGSLIGYPTGFTSSSSTQSVRLTIYDFPEAVTTTTYSLYGSNGGGTNTLSYPPTTFGALLELTEIMG